MKKPLIGVCKAEELERVFESKICLKKNVAEVVFSYVGGNRHLLDALKNQTDTMEIIYRMKVF